jgi:hypothetical protein
MSTRATLFWFATLMIFAVVSRAQVRGGCPDRCSYDGAVIEPIHRVDLMEETRVSASFCSLACALAWPSHPPRTWWRLRDEITGRPIDAQRATFVASRVVTVPARSERIHVFEDPTAAMSHCVQFGGARIADPFLPPVAGDTDK